MLSRIARPTASRIVVWRGLALLLAGTAAACGDIAVDLGADVVAETAQGAPDQLGDAAVAEIVASDAASAECLTDFDCLGVPGQTACKQPRCVAGACAWIALAPGSLCKEPVGECNEARCTETGACAATAVGDGALCGFGSCGHKCVAGSCKVASDADYDDGNPCTKDSCDQGQKILHEAFTDLTKVCDDGNGCTQGDTCVQGACQGLTATCDDGLACTLDTCAKTTGCTHAATDGLCDDSNPCTVDSCDSSQGCTAKGAATGLACDDANTCTTGDHCQAGGVCTGMATCACTTAADCTNANLCLGAVACVDKKCQANPQLAVQCDAALGGPCVKVQCEPLSGQCIAKAVNEAKACGDGNACTVATACKAGACSGGSALACDDKNPCTADSCAPSQGCLSEPVAGTCDDGSACTTGDTCVNGGCTGSKNGCDDQLACTLDTCDPKSGKCGHTADATLCDDGNPCTSQTCVAPKGCEIKAADGTACSDDNRCTQDKCQGGQCLSVSTCQCAQAADCDDKNPCTADSCNQGKCQNSAAGLNGKACDSGDKCQQALSGVCSSGGCQKTDKPVDCSKLAGPCTTAACDPASGQCLAIAKTDGAACDADNDACTQGDACLGGTCLAGKAADCSGQAGPCQVPVCVGKGRSTVTCSKAPVAKGTACEDGQFCTSGDACDGIGSCVGMVPKSCNELASPCTKGSCDEGKDQCVVQPEIAGKSCDDKLFCTVGDACDGKGACLAAGPLACAGGGCQLGSCDEAAKKCGQVAAKAGTPCSDGDGCTATDACNEVGVCIGSAAKNCVGDTCNDASCNPQTGSCVAKPKTAGMACSDGQACTEQDACDGSGNCKGGSLKSCPSNACNDGFCDVASGSCTTKTKATGALCEDGNSCTTNDACLAGVCKGQHVCKCQVSSQALDCDDKNPCTADLCQADGSGFLQCKNAAQAGATCDDGQQCTSADSCTAAGSCAGQKTDCSDGNTCTVDACSASSGACTHKPDAGSKCNDASACTTADFCSTDGQCIGTAVVCNDGNQCTSDACDPKTGGCTFLTTGGACTDGNPCTVGDVCSGTSCSAGKPQSCDDGNPCTADSCDVATGACKVANVQGPCSDGSACTTFDFCTNGKCQPGKAVVCSDANPCTDDSCNPLKGTCSSVSNAAPCNDKNACTLGDACKFGACSAGAAKECNDGNVCTTDKCDVQTGACSAATNQNLCSDGNACTSGDVCSFGSCKPGVAVSCDDKNPCTLDSCSTKLGCSHSNHLDGKICGPKTFCGKLQQCFPMCQDGICVKPFLE